MTTQIVAPQPGNKTESRTRFQSLWADSEKLRMENSQLESDLDELVERIETEILEAERALGEAMRAAVYRQLDFAQKKSLLKWQRFELGAWIDEHLTFLSRSGLVDEPLRNKLAEVRAQELGISIDSDSELSPAEQMDEYFQAQAEDFFAQAEYESSEESVLGATFDDIDEFLDPDSDELDELELIELLRRIRQDQIDQASAPSPETGKSGSRSISDKVFKRIFRQTAAALHPDRESDAERRHEKHVLMSDLLRARKDFDLMTMIRLHEEYATADSELSTDDQKELEQVLCEYLVQQKKRRDEIIHQTPFHHMAYQDFYSKNSTTVTKKINAHVKAIDKQRLELMNFVEQVKTLKMLKEVLKERYDSDPFRDMLF